MGVREEKERVGKERRSSRFKCGGSSGTPRWVAGTQQDPKGKQNPPGWASLPQKHPQPWAGSGAGETGVCGCTSPSSRVFRDAALCALGLRLSACMHGTSEAARLRSSASAAPHQPGPRGVPLGVQPASWVLRGEGAVPAGPQHWLPSLIRAGVSSTKPPQVLKPLWRL